MNGSDVLAATRAMLLCSVVIPTYRRPEALQNCLVALFGQSLPAEFFEILVVDDAHSDEARRQVMALAHEVGPGGPAVRYLRPPSGVRGPAAARNAGWRAATAPIIAFTDDDTIPTPHWLLQGLHAFTQAGVDAAWGHVVVPLPSPPTDGERNTAGLHGAEFVTANCFVRRAALTAAGGFDERFTRPWREDSDLYFTLLERRARVVAAPGAQVLHPARRAPAAASLAAHRNLYFDALLYKKHPRLYREKIAATPPLLYYVTVLAALAAAAALAAGFDAAALAAGAGWLMLTVRLAIRRQRGCAMTWRHVRDVALTSAVIPFLAVFWRLYGALHFRVPFM